MNHLAHLWLGEDDDFHRLGQILGDFHKGASCPEHWPTSLVDGVLCHRAIDAHCFRSDHWQQLYTLAPEGGRRYMPIVLDVVVDHLLAKHWVQYDDRELREFDTFCCRSFQATRGFWLPEATGYLSRLSEGGRLSGYERWSTVERVLAIIARRFSRAAPFLTHSGDWLPKIMPDIEGVFLSYFKSEAQAMRELRNNMRQ